MTSIYLSNEIRIAECDNRIFKWVKDTLTYPNPEYTTRAHLNKYLGRTPKEVCLYRVSGDLVYVPYGVKDKLKEFIKTNKIRASFIDELAVGEHIDYPDISLRDYQEKAVKTMIDAQGGILQSKAGSGKTQIGLGIVKQLGLKALWLTHTKDLLKQSKERAEEYGWGALIGTITEGKVEIGKGITFATVQTMARLNLSLYKNEWDVIVIDECHRVCGDATKVRQFQKVLENLATKYQFGLSATVHRADGLIDTVYALIGDLKYSIPFEDIKNYITPISIKPVFTNIEMSEEALNYDGTIDYTKLITYLTNNDKRNKIIANDLIFNSFNSNLILSDRLEHLHALYKLLPVCYQRRSAFIDGSMTTKQGKEQRENALKGMRDGSINFLFATYKLAKEGLDIPCLDRLYLTTPQKDYAIIVQSVGRVARKDEHKDHPIVFDYVDDIDYLLRFYNKRKNIYKKEGYEIL